MSADDLRDVLQLLGCERQGLLTLVNSDEQQLHLELWVNDTNRFILEAWPDGGPYLDKLFVQVDDVGQFLPAPMAEVVH